MAHKKALAALTAAALAVTGAVVVPAPALAAYAKQGTDKHVEDVFWLDLAGVTGPDGRIIPGKEATVPGLEGYTVKVKVGDEQLPISTDKKAAAFDIDGVSTLVSTDKEATQKITVTLTKDGKPEPLTLVVPDLNGQKVKVTTSAEDWKGLALEVAPDRLGHKDFSTITRSGSTDVPLVRTDNKDNSTTLTLELGAGEQKAMIGILKARPEAQPTPSADPVQALMEINEAIGAGARAVSDALPTSASETPSSSSETSSASAEPTATATSETETAEPTPTVKDTTTATTSAEPTLTVTATTTATTSAESMTSATSEPTSTKETASTAEESTSEKSTEATSAESTETTTTTPAEPSTEEPTSSTPTEDTKPANPNPKKDGNSGSADIQGNGTNNPPSNPPLEPGLTHPDPPKPNGDSSSSSGAPDTDAVIGSVIGVLTVGGLGAGMLGGAVDKVMTPTSPSKSNSNAKNQRPQQKKPKVTVKQPNGESLTLAEMQQRSNSKSAPTTKSASMGKPKVSTKAKSKTSTRQAQQKKPRISVGKKKSSTKAANSSKKKSSSKKKLADTGAPIGLPIGLASLLIMSGLVLLGVRQRRSQI